MNVETVTMRVKLSPEHSYTPQIDPSSARVHVTCSFAVEIRAQRICAISVISGNDA